MGRKKSKRPFIDKKNSSTFHVLHRSQRDVLLQQGEGGEEGEDSTEQQQQTTILWPSPNNSESTNRAILSPSSSNKKEQQKQAVHQYENELIYQEPESETLLKWKKDLSSIVDDYNYTIHFKQIKGNGDFISSSSSSSVINRQTITSNQQQQQQQEEEELKEVERQLDSIALTSDCMDDDIAEALFHFEEGNFEELLDDFCITAAQEPPSIHSNHDTTTNNQQQQQEEFDYDAHIAQLIQKAKQKQQIEQNQAKQAIKHHNWGLQDQQFFSKATALHQKQLDKEEEDDDDDVLGDLPSFNKNQKYFYENDENEDRDDNNDEEEGEEDTTDLCLKFQETLLDYDNDQWGELEDEAMYIGGQVELEGQDHFDKVLDSFLQQQGQEEEQEEDEDDGDDNNNNNNNEKKKKKATKTKDTSAVYMAPRKRQDGTDDNQQQQKGGFHVLEQNKNNNNDDDDQQESVQQILQRATQSLSRRPLDLPPEEIILDGQSYFSQSNPNPWDCESILSTYSNLDNRPAVIQMTNKKKNKKKQQQQTDEEEDEKEDNYLKEREAAKHILLSQKTGLPLGILPSRHDYNNDNDTLASMNRGEKRNKEESALEKKLRKGQVKQERKLARMQKKMLKQAFTEEWTKRLGQDASNARDVGGSGKSVLRF